jgi:tRNA-modifying protein YgfZ
MKAMVAQDRSVLALNGADAEPFLQNLVTNNVAGLGEGTCVYAALLSPQGKYLFDFLVVRSAEGFLLDIKADRAQALAERLTLYRLRAKVSVEPAPLSVVVGLGRMPEGAVPDPRSPDLGWRAWLRDPQAYLAGTERLDPADWNALRIRAAVPETGLELVAEDAYILEMGFERLHGVDFRKGCYVGQEVTARMRHKTELRKGLVRVTIEGEAPEPGTPILAGGKPAGRLLSASGEVGLAHLRFDRLDGELVAGSARIRPEGA